MFTRITFEIHGLRGFDKFFSISKFPWLKYTMAFIIIRIYGGSLQHHELYNLLYESYMGAYIVYVRGLFTPTTFVICICVWM